MRRRFPAGLEPRFGSQWWALTWPVLQAILADIRRNPKRLDFFRTVWIPDEMVFQTYVNALVPREAIAGFGLTHFQFTNRGKPIVFHDDHADYVRTPRALLRAQGLARGARPARRLPRPRRRARRRRRPRPASARRSDHYKLKIGAQTRYRPPGALFFRDQFVDQSAPVLAAAGDPYVVVVGPPALTRRAGGRLPEPPFTVFGEIFAPGAVDFGHGRPSFGGLRRERHGDPRHAPGALAGPGARPRRASGGVPVLPWSPADQRGLLAAVLRDPAALVVTLPPLSGDPARDRDGAARASLGPARRARPACRSGCPPAQLRAACSTAGGRRAPTSALWLVTGAARRRGPERRPALPPPDLVLPWGADPAPATRAGAAGPSSTPRSPPAGSATPPGSRRSPPRSPPHDRPPEPRARRRPAAGAGARR